MEVYSIARVVFLGPTLKKGSKINADYNKHWLKTEYHQTVAMANMDSKWRDFERTKGMCPNLHYVTVGDECVRPQYKEWDNIVLPIITQGGRSIIPPKHLGFRCDIL